jgi:PAS domain S-box-containing protein
MSMPPSGTVQAMFAASFQASAIAKAVVDLSGHCTLVNPSFAQMLGFAPDELVGVACTEFAHPDDVGADVALFEALIRGERDNYQLEKRYLHRDGRIVDVLLSTAVGRSPDGTPLQFFAEVIDITERKRSNFALQQANAQLHELAVTDHLTGLRNLRGFEEAMLNAKVEEPLSVLVVDLDNFKHVNDRLGHEAGDGVLVEAGRRLLGELRRVDRSRDWAGTSLRWSCPASIVLRQRWLPRRWWKNSRYLTEAAMRLNGLEPASGSQRASGGTPMSGISSPVLIRRCTRLSGPDASGGGELRN